MTLDLKRQHASIKTFVDPKVQTIAVTDAIIHGLYRHFPLSAKVISGYMSEEQLYWKVNHHWEVLLEAVDHCSHLVTGATDKKTLESIRKSLQSNQPDPTTGYRKSKVIGLPKDKTGHKAILARHALVRQGKLDLGRVIKAAGLGKKSPRGQKALDYACAPIAVPAKGKHSTGHALDISGNNLEIVAIAHRMGATRTFNEGSHVHCEWAEGVDLAGHGGHDRAKAKQRHVKQLIDSRVIAPKHCLLRNV